MEIEHSRIENGKVDKMRPSPNFPDISKNGRTSMCCVHFLNRLRVRQRRKSHRQTRPPLYCATNPITDYTPDNSACINGIQGRNGNEGGFFIPAYKIKSLSCKHHPSNSRSCPAHDREKLQHASLPPGHFNTFISSPRSAQSIGMD